jgi:hypothetical protein
MMAALGCNRREFLALASLALSVPRYRHRVHIWDVINEAHVQPETDRGMKGFTREENVDLTVSALRTAHEADPTCFRIVDLTRDGLGQMVERLHRHASELGTMHLRLEPTS